MAGFVSQNPLERALVDAATDPAGRPNFYRALLGAQLFTIDHRPVAPAPSAMTLEPGTSLRVPVVEIGGEAHSVVFSSVQRIQEMVSEEVNCVEMAATDLLGVLRGSSVVMNPGSVYSKQFTPDEIESILDGSVFSQHETHTVAASRQVRLGQPSDPPSHIIDALARFFSGRKEVDAAYLAHLFDPSRGEQPHTLIGINSKGDFERLAGDATLVLQGVARDDDVVDIVQIDDSDLSQYMVENIEPFYRRKKRFGLF